MEAMIRNRGIRGALEEITGVGPESDLGRRILGACEALSV
jgi:hypothetical protein